MSVMLFGKVVLFSPRPVRLGAGKTASLAALFRFLNSRPAYIMT